MDLEREKAVWITSNNVDAKITADLFTEPKTTGLVTRYSEYWKYQLFTLDVKRLLSPEFVKFYGERTADNRVMFRGHVKSSKKMMVGDHSNIHLYKFCVETDTI